jgi:general secretion pathway protein A
LRVAGATADIFTNGALREIYRVSHGIPRVINIICDRALLGAYTQDLHQIPASLVRRASAEVFDHDVAPGWIPFLVGGLALMILVGSGALLWRWVPGLHHVSQAGATQLAAVPASVPAAAPGITPTPVPPLAATANAASATMASPDLPQLLAVNKATTDPDSAFGELLGLWKISYAPGKVDGCSQAIAQGLRCLIQRGSLAQLRQLNRPAILMLSDESGAQYQIVLRQLGDTSAQLQIGTQTVTINVADLTRYWFGDFVLLWHPASKDVRDLSAGMHGAQVRQLRAQLNHWSGAAGSIEANAAGDEYDASLVQLVEQFQRASRLQVDGIAGIETQVALDSALATPDSPLLQSRSAQQASTRGS